MSAALSPRLRVAPQRTPCGQAALDELLEGGLAAGSLTEFVGPEGSGRTTAALAYVAAVIRKGGVCAWIDVSDALDPESAAANGVDLERLLWVRCGGQAEQALQVRPEERRLDLSGGLRVAAPRHTGGGSPHPRSEGRDMPEAIGAVLRAHGGLYDRQVRREKKIAGAGGVPGTPGALNRSVMGRPQEREEQVNSDRLPPRRGENLAMVPRCAEPQMRFVAQQLRGTASFQSNERLLQRPTSGASVFKNGTSPWKALDQALRATDLVLQNGGFSAVVLDLASVPPEYAWRIPLATWYRFRAACERTRVGLILLTQHPCARSSAEQVVRLHAASMEAQNKVMTGMCFRAATERSRSNESSGQVVSISKPPARKPPQPERPGQWTSDAAWVRAR